MQRAKMAPTSQRKERITHFGNFLRAYGVPRLNGRSSSPLSKALAKSSLEEKELGILCSSPGQRVLRRPAEAFHLDLKILAFLFYGIYTLQMERTDRLVCKFSHFVLFY